MKNIKLLIVTVEGALTDGVLRFTSQGEDMIALHHKDALGLELLSEVGISIAVISSRRSAALDVAIRELGFKLHKLGRKDTARAVAELLSNMAIQPQEVAFIGADLTGYSIMSEVGLAICPSDAIPEIIASSTLVTEAPSGKGAVREACDHLIRLLGEEPLALCT